MKNLTKIVSSVLAIGMLVTTGITSFATADTEANTTTTSSNTTISEESRDRGSMKRGRGGFGNMEKPELTDEQKAEMAANMKERLAQQLKDGNITQEQYDQAITNIAEGKKPMSLGRGKGRGGFGNIEKPELTDEQKAEMADNMKERLAQQLKDGNITQEQYDQAIANIAEGKKPMSLGRGKGRGQRGLCNTEAPKLTDDQK